MLDPSLVGERHYEVARGVQKLLQDYKSLQDIIAILGMDELSEEDMVSALNIAQSAISNGCLCYEENFLKIGKEKKNLDLQIKNVSQEIFNLLEEKYKGELEDALQSLAKSERGGLLKSITKKVIKKLKLSQVIESLTPKVYADEGALAFKGDERQTKIYEKLSKDWTVGEASYYNPTNPAETRPGTNGVGAYGRKVEPGSVAFGNRVFHDALKKGEVIYVKVKGFENVKTPYGNGVFRVDDTMNLKYSKKGQFNIDFHPQDSDEAQKKTGRFKIEFKLVEPNGRNEEKPPVKQKNRNQSKYYA
jgi:hypothetical protein